MAETPTRAARVERFRALHRKGEPFVIPNPWDLGSARILAGLGFPALATTSSGLALTVGRRDYRMARDEVIAHCRALCAGVEVPVSADLENGFGARPEDAASTIIAAAEAGLAGGSIEDSTGDRDAPIFDLSLAVERVAAAVEAARQVPGGFVLTARAEAFLHGQKDLDAVMERLQAFQRAGAEVLYAPGLSDLASVRTVCSALERPVNVLAYGQLRATPVSALAEAGAARISLGGRPAFTAYASLFRLADVLDGKPFDTHDSDLQARIPELFGWLK